MRQAPTMAVPPRGALEPKKALEEYLPDEWRHYMAAKEAVEAQQTAMRVPPGGWRWPETEARYIAPIKAARQTELQLRRGELQAKWNELVGALLRKLKCGALHAYAEPVSLNEPYLFIPVALWQQLATIKVCGRDIMGLRPEPVRLLICKAEQGARKGSRPPGRPPADAREFFEGEFQARGVSGERLDGAHKEAAAILRILKERHPDIVLPQQQTAAKWIRPRMKPEN